MFKNDILIISTFNEGKLKKLLIVLILFPLITKAEVYLGPSVSFLSTPHPWSLSLNFKKSNLMAYVSYGAFRSLEYNEEPLKMKNQALGIGYLWTKGFYTGLEYGSQEIESIYGEGKLKNTYIVPKVGYEFNFKTTNLFIQSELGYQINFDSSTFGNNPDEIKALEHFGKESLINFTLFKIGYYF